MTTEEQTLLELCRKLRDAKSILQEAVDRQSNFKRSVISRSSAGVQRSGMRGIKVGLVGLISNDNAKSAYGYRLELDSAWTAMTNIPGSKVEGIGVYCKGLKIGSSGDEVPGSSDIDVFLRISDERLAVQTKISASADHVAKLPNWIRVATSADNIPGGQLCPDGAGMRDRLLKCRFYFDFDGRSSGDIVNDVAEGLMKDSAIEKAFNSNVTELISFLTNNGLVSDIIK